jgi:hypothetical protein
MERPIASAPGYPCYRQKTQKSHASNATGRTFARLLHLRHKNRAHASRNAPFSGNILEILPIDNVEVAV